MRYRQLEVTTAEWWAGLGEWVIKLSVIVAAVTLLLRTPMISRVVFRFGHWLWNFPLISMSVEGLRDVVRGEVEPVATKLDEVGNDLSGFRAENANQHAQVTARLLELSATVDDHTTALESQSKRLSAVELAMMTRRRRDDEDDG